MEHPQRSGLGHFGVHPSPPLASDWAIHPSNSGPHAEETLEPAHHISSTPADPPNRPLQDPRTKIGSPVYSWPAPHDTPGPPHDAYLPAAASYQPFFYPPQAQKSQYPPHWPPPYKSSRPLLSAPSAETRTGPGTPFMAVDPFRSGQTGFINLPTIDEDQHSGLPTANSSTSSFAFPSRLHALILKLNVTYIYLFGTLPRQVYLSFLLRLPAFYFSRVTIIFKEAHMTMEEIKELALGTSDPMVFQKLLRMSPSGENLTVTWEGFIDSVMREWKTLNIVSVLLLSAILSLLQIESASAEPITRSLALASLICALMSLLYGCMYIIRFSSMRKPIRSVQWALEAQKTEALILWNVWVLLAMPAAWLAWSVILYIACIMSFVWRTNTLGPENDLVLTTAAELAIRIMISTVLGLGLVYFALILNTFRHYGTSLDKKYQENLASSSPTQDGQPANEGLPGPLSPPSESSRATASALSHQAIPSQNGDILQDNHFMSPTPFQDNSFASSEHHSSYKADPSVSHANPTVHSPLSSPFPPALRPYHYPNSTFGHTQNIPLTALRNTGYASPAELRQYYKEQRWEVQRLEPEVEEQRQKRKVEERRREREVKEQPREAQQRGDYQDDGSSPSPFLGRISPSPFVHIESDVEEPRREQEVNEQRQEAQHRGDDYADVEWSLSTPAKGFIRIEPEVEEQRRERKVEGQQREQEVKEQRPREAQQRGDYQDVGRSTSPFLPRMSTTPTFLPLAPREHHSSNEADHSMNYAEHPKVHLPLPSPPPVVLGRDPYRDNSFAPSEHHSSWVNHSMGHAEYTPTVRLPLPSLFPPALQPDPSPNNSFGRTQNTLPSPSPVVLGRDPYRDNSFAPSEHHSSWVNHSMGHAESTPTVRLPLPSPFPPALQPDPSLNNSFGRFTALRNTGYVSPAELRQYEAEQWEAQQQEREVEEQRRKREVEEQRREREAEEQRRERAEEKRREDYREIGMSTSSAQLWNSTYHHGHFHPQAHAEFTVTHEPATSSSDPTTSAVDHFTTVKPPAPAALVTTKAHTPTAGIPIAPLGDLPSFSTGSDDLRRSRKRLRSSSSGEDIAKSARSGNKVDPAAQVHGAWTSPVVASMSLTTGGHIESLRSVDSEEGPRFSFNKANPLVPKTGLLPPATFTFTRGRHWYQSGSRPVPVMTPPPKIRSTGRRMLRTGRAHASRRAEKKEPSTLHDVVRQRGRPPSAASRSSSSSADYETPSEGYSSEASVRPRYQTNHEVGPWGKYAPLVHDIPLPAIEPEELSPTYNFVIQPPSPLSNDMES